MVRQSSRKSPCLFPSWCPLRILEFLQWKLMNSRFGMMPKTVTGHGNATKLLSVFLYSRWFACKVFFPAGILLYCSSPNVDSLNIKETRQRPIVLPVPSLLVGKSDFSQIVLEAAAWTSVMFHWVDRNLAYFKCCGLLWALFIALQPSSKKMLKIFF